MAIPKKSKHVEVEVSTERDDLALLLQKELNKGGGKSAFFLDEDDSPTQITEWVSTGSTLLDLAISNRANGGLPVSRMVELSGLEGTGKSLICAQIIAETQRKGGNAVFFDSEFSVDKNFWVALGVDIKNVNYVNFTTLEELFTKLEMCIGAYRKADKNRLLTIFVDSVAQASVEKEMESEHGVDGYNTGKSIIISKAMRKITGLIAKQRILLVFTNQVRYNMNAGPFGDKWCVDPFSTKIKIRYKLKYINELNNEWIEEEISISEFCERFLGLNEFDTPDVYDISDKEIEILGKDLKSGEDIYKLIKSFIVKDEANEYYFDGKLKATAKHVILENNNEIYVKDHPDFKLIRESIKVVDFEIDDIHNYYANGRLNHNTVPGGKALPFACSVRLRLANLGKIKNSAKEVIGMECQAQVIKNRCGPNYRAASFDIMYDSGIQDISSWIDYMKLHGIISGDGHGYSYKRPDGSVLEFKPIDFPNLLNNDLVLKEEIYQSICSSYIMKYRTPNSKIVEDVERTNTENDDITINAVKED